jgi:hypothetical protein
VPYRSAAACDLDGGWVGGLGGRGAARPSPPGPYSHVSHSPAAATTRPRPVRQCSATAPPVANAEEAARSVVGEQAEAVDAPPLAEDARILGPEAGLLEGLPALPRAWLAR